MFKALENYRSQQKKRKLYRKLYQAVLESRYDVVEELLKNGADPNIYYLDSDLKKIAGQQYREFPKFLVTLAYSYQDLRVVTLLLQYKADASMAGIDLSTTLIHAALAKNTAVLCVLLKAGASFNRTDICGNTALNYAINNNSKNMICAIVTHIIARGTAEDLSTLKPHHRILDKYKSWQRNYEDIPPTAMIDNNTKTGKNIGLLFVAYLAVKKNKADNITVDKGLLKGPKETIDNFFIEKVDEVLPIKCNTSQALNYQSLDL